jgi:hypothetical protein
MAQRQPGLAGADDHDVVLLETRTLRSSAAGRVVHIRLRKFHA